MDRKQLKAQSKQLIKTAQPKPVVMAIIYLLIMAVLNFLSFKLVGGYDVGEMNEQFDAGFNAGYYYNDYDNVDPDMFAYVLEDALEDALPSPAAALLDAAIEVVSIMLGAGFIIFCLRTLRGMEASYWNIFDSFGMFIRILWLYILEGVFVFLWALLFVIPGIIAMYRYRMAIYLLLEHPEMSALDCIRESKRLMAGHKWELFALDVSFIGWLLLVAAVNYAGEKLAVMMPTSIITEIMYVIGIGVIVQFFVFPYMELTVAGYYKQLVEADKTQNPFGDGWTPEL